LLPTRKGRDAIIIVIMSSIPPASSSSPSPPPAGAGALGAPLPLSPLSQPQQVAVTSDRMVPQILQTGLERIVLRTAAGAALGGLAGIVLARGGAHGLRRGLAGLGGGLGLGSAWTQTSIRLQELLEEEAPPLPPSADK
jgi:hypothetical protein